jgi:hypothetical protein
LVATTDGAPIDQFHTANFNNAVALFDFNAGGFGIENDLSFYIGIHL